MALKTAMYDLLAEDHPMTIRHLFYRISSAGWIDKSEAEYSNVVCRLTAEMRKAGDLPFEWIIDENRWMLKGDSFDNLAAFYEDARRTYRRALWREQPYYCEVWTEKKAISSILFPITREFDVPLMPASGFASLSFLHSSGQVIKRIGKPTYIYYFGDWDPSGLSISQNIEDGLRKYAGGIEVIFRRLAVKEEQIEELRLPTRPTKTSDSRSKNFQGDSVEVDAIHKDTLQRLCRSAVEGLIDRDAYNTVLQAEKSEREVLAAFAK